MMGMTGFGWEGDIWTESYESGMAVGYNSKVTNDNYTENGYEYADGEVLHMTECEADVYEAHCELLKSLASKSNCIIVGRCADYILKDFKPFKIFIYADLEARVDRCIKRQSEDEKYSRKQLRKMIVKIDKNRARYYDFFANQTWGDKDNYDLCINTTNQVIKDIVPVMAKIFKD